MSFINYTPAKELLDAARAMLAIAPDGDRDEALQRLKEKVEAADACVAEAGSRENARAILMARDIYARPSGDDIEIDDAPMVSAAENGTWIQAWVWVQRSLEVESLMELAEKTGAPAARPAAQALVFINSLPAEVEHPHFMVENWPKETQESIELLWGDTPGAAAAVEFTGSETCSYEFGDGTRSAPTCAALASTDAPIPHDLLAYLTTKFSLL